MADKETQIQEISYLVIKMGIYFVLLPPLSPEHQILTDADQRPTEKEIEKHLVQKRKKSMKAKEKNQQK